MQRYLSAARRRRSEHGRERRALTMPKIPTVKVDSMQSVG